MAAFRRSSSTASPGDSSTTTRSDPDGFEAGLAAAVNELIADVGLATEMGAAGRERAVTEFGWDAAARRTLEIYRPLIGAS